ncbi:MULTISPECIES: hypothetical protein [Pantoea]|uniref:hypothetical protein n=1 Tax=Pantoea TaxID=53335 RepID=UPI00065F83C2|nr:MULTISPECIES: hypothetical protein [Pantoea]MDU2731663.1 hypothetical protein [Pantoea sp.]MDU5476181.1 hypothetical protein [Pantoea sp.]
MHYITDQRADEPDILTPVKTGKLTICSLDGQIIHTQAAPENGWTHLLLCEVQPEGMESGADAWLDDVWIGSTEV